MREARKAEGAKAREPPAPRPCRGVSRFSSLALDRRPPCLPLHMLDGAHSAPLMLRVVPLSHEGLVADQADGVNVKAIFVMSTDIIRCAPARTAPTLGLLATAVAAAQKCRRNSEGHAAQRGGFTTAR